MYSEPSVTVIIPFKNNIKYLFSALNSVFNQSYKNFKIFIIYDDEDKTDLHKIKKYLKSENNTQFSSIKIKDLFLTRDLLILCFNLTPKLLIC